jgi:hypothetical protein
MVILLMDISGHYIGGYFFIILGYITSIGEYSIISYC